MGLVSPIIKLHINFIEVLLIPVTQILFITLVSIGCYVLVKKVTKHNRFISLLSGISSIVLCYICYQTYIYYLDILGINQEYIHS